jgi:hypothetical protein
MGKTSTKSKDKYNEAAYARYTVRIRKDEIIYEVIEEFMNHKGTSFNHVVTLALEKYFAGAINKINYGPDEE